MCSVLLVDDNNQILALYRMILEQAGHQVRTASGRGSALDALAESTPQVVIIDLRLPDLKDGLSVIRAVHESATDEKVRAKVIVISGWIGDLENTPEAHQIDRALSKPVRVEVLLRSISEVMLMLFMCLIVVRALAAETFRFNVKRRAEVVAELNMSSPGSNWSAPGREAALADLTVDRATTQNIMLYAGEDHYTYPAFLGALDAGPHELQVDRDTRYSAPASGLEIHGARFREVGSDDPYWSALAHAPVLYARANTIGGFTDIPLISYCERLSENGRPILQYTMIFSNEDGGTSTRALMARWGRTTDVEYIYRAWFDAGGQVENSTIQAEGHKEVTFRGRRDGTHPILIPSTDNNMVADEGTSPVRYQIPPVIMNLAAHSREQVIDEHPIAYRVMAQELAHEQKLRPFGTVDGEKVSDPRNYLYIEAKVKNRDSAIATLVHLSGSERWLSSHLGRNDYAISRNGWVRTTVELPPGTEPRQINELGFECLVPVDEDQKRQPLPAGPAISADCTLEQVSKVFLLDREYRPQPSLWNSTAPVEIPSGQIRIFPVR
jgi:CheY-like chemotaxis protein